MIKFATTIGIAVIGLTLAATAPAALAAAAKQKDEKAMCAVSSDTCRPDQAPSWRGGGDHDGNDGPAA